MAVAWIEKVSNFYTGPLEFNEKDYDRQGKQKGAAKEFGVDEWIRVDAGASMETENFSVPWSAPNKGLYVRWNAGGKQLLVKIDMQGKDAWDFVRIRDSEDRVLAEIEAGSLGYAAGTNFSGWHLNLHSDGTLGLHREWRQGLSLAGAQKLGGVLLGLADTLINAGASIITSGAGAAGTILAAAIAA